MTPPPDSTRPDLPRTTAGIAAWLGEVDPAPLAELRAWHGDAIVVYGLEQVADLPVEERGAAFFKLMKSYKALRRGMYTYPRMTYTQWCEDPERRE